MAEEQLRKSRTENSSINETTGKSCMSLKKVKLFGCELCNYSFTKQVLLTRHQRVHNHDKPFSCKECDKRFTQSGSLNRHIFKAHTSKGVLNFSISKDITETYTGPSNLTVDGSVDDAVKPYVCPECDARFTQLGSLKRHRLRVHASVKNFKCHICAYACATKDDLQSHVLVHGEEKPFQCTKCNAAFTIPSRLRKHQARAHEENKHLKCSDCNYTCSFPSGLKAHQLVHSKRKTHKCADCGKWFLRLWHLTRHRLTDHSECLVFCDYCNYSCSIKEQLQSHVKYHHTVKSFKCDKCNAAFITRYRLKRHNLTVHIKETRLKCSVCHYKCYYKSELEKHKYTHRKCKLMISDGPRLLDQTPKTADKEIFKCSICELTVGSKLSLDLHLSVHTGNAPYRCSVCGSSFSVEKSLKKHIDNFHCDKVH